MNHFLRQHLPSFFFPRTAVSRRRRRDNAGQRITAEVLERRELLAADIQLVRNIRTQLNEASSTPDDLTTVGSTIFFTATNATQGTELWKSNGTAAGTLLVKDIYPGSHSSAPDNLVNVNGVLYFTATNGVNGRELWKSNGTAAGTVLVKDLNAGAGDSSPSSLTNVSGTLYFAATHATTTVWNSGRVMERQPELYW